MLKHLTHFVLLVNFLTPGVFCDESSVIVAEVVNITEIRATRPPLQPPTGLFKYVEACENFCDDHFEPGVLGVLESNGVLGCHKGCYSFELFKAMGKSKSFSILEKICNSNCQKDFGENSFVANFCILGCGKINMLYGNRVKVLSKDVTSRLEPKNVDDEDLLRQKYSVQAEIYLTERDLMIAEEIAVHVIMEEEKMHAVRYITSSGRAKNKYVFVERLWLSPEYHEYMHSERKKMFEEAEARVPELKPDYNLAEIYEAERKEWSGRSDNAKPEQKLLTKHFYTKCPSFQPFPTFIAGFFSSLIITIYIWVTFGDSMLGVGRKYWDKLDYMDTYSVDIDEDDMVTSQDTIINKQMKEMNLVMSEGDQYYALPPPDKDAPPPYVEININEPNNVEVRK
uniref:Uncharacterized protein n=1 Tax=Cacopsylla melanoneura TaxID=428564 RepID=A0A8D8LTI5_9HEMI